MNHPVRLAFLRLLKERPTLTVSEGAQVLGDPISISTLSYHVSVLRGEDLVETAGALSLQGSPMRLTDRGVSTLEILGHPGVEGPG
jgi:DNA-binding transcriptional ArsR family regulator